MTSLALIRAGLTRHGVAHAAAAIGVAVGAMVLAGALLLGSSLRQSLQASVLGRLGWVDRVLVAERPFRAALADGLPGRVAPVLVARASVRVTGGSVLGKITLMGVDDRYFGADGPPTGWPGDGFWINEDLQNAIGNNAARLSITVGPAGSGPPRESLLGQAEDATAPWEAPVAGCLNGLMSHFSISEGVGPSRLVLVPLAKLQERLSQPGRANALLADGAPGLDSALSGAIQAEDHGLVLRTPSSRAADLFSRSTRMSGTARSDLFRRLARSEAMAAFGREGAVTAGRLEDYYSRDRRYILVESSGLYLSSARVASVERAASKAGVPSAPVLVHLANAIAETGGNGRQIPYSVVAATRPVPGLTPPITNLGDDGIAIVDWKDSPLNDLKSNSVLEVRYYPVESGGSPREAAPARFTVKAHIKQEGMAIDPAMAPEFPGITDRAEMGQWSAPFPIDLKRVASHDETYWRDYRAAPKAYISWEAGQRLWAGRFGDATSVRIGIPEHESAESTLERLRTALKQELVASESGLVFRDTRAIALAAVANGSDFGMLYLGFSSFIIMAALALTALLFRLGLERRATEIGLLKAIGYTDSHVRNLYLAEGAVVALVGSFIGALASAIYTPALLAYLSATWPDPSLGALLRFSLDPLAMALGGLSAFVAGVVAIIVSMRDLVKMQPLALLRGVTRLGESVGPARSRFGWLAAILTASAGAILAAGSPFLPPGEPRSGGFFTAGLLFLAAGLMALNALLKHVLKWPLFASSSWPLFRLAARNAARRPARSLVTAGLLASASFLLVAVEAFRREAHPPTEADALAVWAEMEVPVLVDPRTTEGRTALLDAIERTWRDDPAEASRRRSSASALLDRISLIPLRLAGEGEAGCLNLTRPDQPRVVAAPAGSLTVADLPVAARMGGDTKPLPALLDEVAPGAEAMVAGEASALTWILKKAPGDSLCINSSEDTVRVAAALHDGPFPSELLMGESAFLRMFPQTEGWRVVLVRAAPTDIPEVLALLRTAWADKGAEVVPLVDRVNKYLAVENSYLGTFQALGGLGLILGTAGLAIVLLRAVWERRGELALLAALGYRPGRITLLVLLESAALLLAGLGTGTIAALLAVIPHGGVSRSSLPGLALTLLACLVTGLLAGVLSAAMAQRARVIEALRQDA